MIVLALEFSSASRSVALVREDGTEGGTLLAEASEIGGRPARPLTLVESVLKRSGIERSALGGIVVGLGPGSYTGIRLALALAQGWQLACNIPVAGVSTFECLAGQARTLGWLGAVSIAIDAQRNEYYLASYEITTQGSEVRTALHLASPDEARALAESPSGLLIGPEVERLSPKARPLLPQAHGLVRCLAKDWKQTSAETLEPIYLREVAFVKAPPLRVYKE